MKIASAKDLTVYKKAYALAMRIFEVTQRFPPEERYALSGQLRRSSRSPCRSLREAWAKRRYEAHYARRDGQNAGEIYDLRPLTADLWVAGEARFGTFGVSIQFSGVST